MEIKIPAATDFELIRKYIAEFELDNRALDPAQFLAAYREGQLVGFGRIRPREGCDELCSLGVVTPYRRKRIGSALVKALVNKATQPLYLVCIIPEFFAPFGFSIVADYPAPLEEKRRYCVDELVVPEPYVVMKYRS